MTTLLLPRLGRDDARDVVARNLPSDPLGLTSAMPDLRVSTTFSPVGGISIEPRELAALRTDVLKLARAHGMPGPLVGLSVFQGECARLLHERLQITPHEASHEEVWSYLTCCWLLDVAVWRFGRDADENRFIGNVNRNTFRVMWWRVEVLGPDVDLTRLGEDELVSIMERPTVASDRRLARAIAVEFLRRVEAGEAPERMQLMREAMKRILRLTPLVAFSALDDLDLVETVTEAFDAARAGLNGEPPPTRQRSPRPTPPPTPDVVSESTPVFTAQVGDDGTSGRGQDFEMIAQAALDLAGRLGRVTNLALREVAPISPEEAREVFTYLMSRGILHRRGVKRGTYYVLAEQGDAETAPRTSIQDEDAGHDSEEQLITDVDGRFEAAALDEPASDSALRRLLRRRSP